MENIWLRYKEPEAYRDITARISRNVEDKDKAIDAFIKPIREALKRACFDFEIRKRIKTPYSIWHKMQTKGVPFEQVYDLYAVRIIFTPDPGSVETERDQCYHIFSIITVIYRYQADRIRDWVNHPKSNGYEALHCTLIGETGMRVEVQIRSKRMDDIAEKGIAAHWAYKKEGYLSEQDSEMDKWLAKIKDILTQRGDISSLELLDMVHEDLTEKEIVVFTPKGEQRSVPRGATALDFAYLIHTHIGNKAIAAKVNMRLVPLDHVLSSGDSVEIITAESGEPKKEWLQFLRTRHAISLVIDHFRDQADELKSEGAKILSDAMRKAGRSLSNRNIKHLLLSTQLSSKDELCFRLGLGLVKPEEVIASFTNWDSPVAPRPDNLVIDSQTEGGVRRYIIASCCGPIPGDPVIGFRSPDGKTVTIHKKSCPVAQAVTSKHEDWVVTPNWEDVRANSVFPVRISLRGIDRLGLLNDITHFISQDLGVNMTKLMLGVNGGIFEGYIEMYVSDKKLLNRLIKQLSAIDGIESVDRTEL
jgi:GTP pyrophosphokinase